MPRPRKGPRLYLRAARPEKRQSAGWVIRDAGREFGTGCGPEQRTDAEIALGQYIVEKHRPEGQGSAGRRGGARDPHDVLVADVLSLYATEKGPKLADPVSASYRIESLLAFWTLGEPEAPLPDGRDGTLASIRRSTCAAYVAWRTAQPRRAFKDPETAPRVTDQAARRELEDLSAAIGWFAAEHPLTRRPTVTLPEKAESPRDALTRDQAARLLKAALGYRWDPDLIDARTGRQGGWIRLGATARTNRLHLRRFLMLGFYTGTRHTVLLRLLWAESPTQAWVDLEGGVIYRRGRRERDHRTKRRPICQIPPRLLSCLRRWKRLDDARQAVMQQAHLDRGGDPAQLPQLASVIHFGGHPLAARIRTGFESLVADAGLPPEITPHWMRHSCATWLMEADVRPWIAAGFMGMSTQILEDTYGHHRPNHQAETRLGAGGRRRQES